MGSDETRVFGRNLSGLGCFKFRHKARYEFSYFVLFELFPNPKSAVELCVPGIFAGTQPAYDLQEPEGDRCLEEPITYCIR